MVLTIIVTIAAATVMPSLLPLLCLLLLLPLLLVAPPPTAPRGSYPGRAPPGKSGQASGMARRRTILERPPAATRLIPEKDLRGGGGVRRVSVIQASSFSAQVSKTKLRCRVLWRGGAQPQSRVTSASSPRRGTIIIIAIRGGGRLLSLAVRRAAAAAALLRRGCGMAGI